MVITTIPQISLEAVRVNMKMNQSEWAECIGVELSTIFSWESGRTEPSLSQLIKMSEISNIPIDFIFVPDES